MVCYAGMLEIELGLDYVRGSIPLQCNKKQMHQILCVYDIQYWIMDSQALINETDNTRGNMVPKL